MKLIPTEKLKMKVVLVFFASAFTVLQWVILYYLVGSLKDVPRQEAVVVEEEIGYKKPFFTKIPTLTVSVKPKDTATLIANIDGVPRPNGEITLPVSTASCLQ